VTAGQARRLRAFRSRIVVRAFEYRQRRLARGVWFRLRRLLASTQASYALTHEDAERLIAEGCSPHPLGRELSPERLFVVVPAERVASLSSAKPVPVRLGVELLSAECLALVPFPT
jgi:hypothetical protein